MQAVLVICHGSRLKSAKEEAKAFAEQSLKKVEAPIKEICFLELATPTIEQGFVQCMRKGATRICVIPLLLLSAVHAKQDIPNELSRLQSLYPEILITYGTPIGANPGILHIILDKIKETGEEIHPDANILLVGRGSSDPDVKKDLGEIANMFHQHAAVKQTDICFLTAAKPVFEEALNSAVKSFSSQVFIVPYLLFTGLLMNGIERKIREKKNNKLILTDYLGSHPEMIKIFSQKINDTLNGKKLFRFSSYGRYDHVSSYH
jgi:sirohydrochlorin ferrochelatase